MSSSRAPVATHHPSPPSARHGSLNQDSGWKPSAFGEVSLPPYLSYSSCLWRVKDRTSGDVGGPAAGANSLTREAWTCNDLLSFFVFRQREEPVGPKTRVARSCVLRGRTKASRQVEDNSVLFWIYERNSSLSIKHDRSTKRSPFDLRHTAHSAAAVRSTHPPKRASKHRLAAEWHPHEDEGGGEGEGEEEGEEVEGARKVEERARGQRVSGCPCADVWPKKQT